MIPKKIHYCWFGGNRHTSEMKKCIKSWKSDAVLLKNGMEISIAQSKRASFKQAVFNYGRSKEVI